ncbi:MAG: 3-oxoacyl-ACP reductase [Actinomycetota bacterium]|nr:3-oxoacyl-ACP reductase [Actinomycetota bacterium]
MNDRYQFLAHTPVGQFVVRNLGLPDPPALRRHRPDEPLVDGTVLLGAGDNGRLLGPVGAQLDAADVTVATAGADDARHRGLIFDATGITEVSGLLALRDFFAPRLRSLERNGRIVVLGTPVSAAGDAAAAITQRALEGFTRSLAKEVGRGSTVQLVYVEPGFEDTLTSTLLFLLSAKSAYVSGQVVRIGTAGSPAAPPVVDAATPLAGKVALVTGAARGIGAAIARVLARDGATVVGLDVAQATDQLHRLTRELGGSAIVLDITAADAVQRIAAKLEEQHGGVDVIVHNAGITRDKKLANMSAQRWISTIDVNLVAPQRITDELLAQGLIRPNARIIGVASIAGIAGNLGQTNYATSKAGVIGLVDVLSTRLADTDITANAVAPGFIETQMTATIPFLLREAGRRMNSMSQGGLAVDVAETIAWLADPRSGAVRGNVVRVCGQSLLGA